MSHNTPTTPDPVNRRTFLVTVSDVTDDQAAQVMAERLAHDEDYGFRYTLDYRRIEQLPIEAFDAWTDSSHITDV